MRSPLGKVLGREWHRDTVYGVAGRSYIASGDDRRPVDQLATSSCATRTAKVLSGYGWIFPLGTGEVNIGVGTLATSKRPADLAIKPLMAHYAELRREEFELSGELRMPTSRAAADGRRGQQRGRPQLGADRRRRRLREPAQRRGHRLRPRDRPAGRRR